MHHAKKKNFSATTAENFLQYGSTSKNFPPRRVFSAMPAEIFSNSVIQRRSSYGSWIAYSLKKDLTLLQSIFFPPKFSFVFCKRKIWREKIYSSKE
jgi:hypothetical protein